MGRARQRDIEYFACQVQKAARGRGGDQNFLQRVRIISPGLDGMICNPLGSRDQIPLSGAKGEDIGKEVLAFFRDSTDSNPRYVSSAFPPDLGEHEQTIIPENYVLIVHRKEFSEREDLTTLWDELQAYFGEDRLKNGRFVSNSVRGDVQSLSELSLSLNIGSQFLDPKQNIRLIIVDNAAAMDQVVNYSREYDLHPIELDLFRTAVYEETLVSRLGGKLELAYLRDERVKKWVEATLVQGNHPVRVFNAESFAGGYAVVRVLPRNLSPNGELYVHFISRATPSFHSVGQGDFCLEGLVHDYMLRDGTFRGLSHMNQSFDPGGVGVAAFLTEERRSIITRQGVFESNGTRPVSKMLGDCSENAPLVLATTEQLLKEAREELTANFDWKSGTPYFHRMDPLR